MDLLPVNVNYNNKILTAEAINDRMYNVVETPPDIRFQVHEKVSVKTRATEYRDPLVNINDNELLSQTFFSSDNIQIIQNGLRFGVYKKSNEQYLIPPQNVDTLLIIMKSIFTQYANMRDNITQQIKKLNKLVLDYSIPNVFNEADAYMKFRRDQSSLVVPISLPMQSDRDYKELEMKSLI